MSDLKELFATDALHVHVQSDEQIKSAQEACEHLYHVEAQIKQLEETVAALKEERKVITQRTLPTFLDSIGMDRVGLPAQGVDIVVENYYHANIPPEHEAAAFNWLDENGHGDLIKLTLTVALAKGDYETGKKLLERIEAYLLAAKVKATVSSKLGVPWNTLTAFVKEQTTAGVALPLELLGATIGRIVKIKTRKN